MPRMELRRGGRNEIRFRFGIATRRFCRDRRESRDFRDCKTMTGVEFKQGYADWHAAAQRLEDTCPERIADWPKIQHCIIRGSGFALETDLGELIFDPLNPTEGTYTSGKETGRVDRIRDLKGEEFKHRCPEPLKKFQIRFAVVTVSETIPVGHEFVWFVGLDGVQKSEQVSN